MSIKHFLAVLGLSLISLGMSAQISISVTDNASKGSGSDKHHKIRFDYVICDSSNKIVKVENSEFTMSPGSTKQLTLTAPTGYHVDPVVHLQLRQRPGDDTKWHNSPYGLGTFYVTNGRINLVVEGSSKKGYELMLGSASSPAFTKDELSGDDWRDAQNANKGQLSLGGKQAQKEKTLAAMQARNDILKAAAEKKAAEEKAAEEARKMADFNRVEYLPGNRPAYLPTMKLVVRDYTDKGADGSQVRLRFDYVLCDASTYQMKRVETKEIVFNSGAKDSYTRDISVPSGYVIKNQDIHYEIRVRYTPSAPFQTAESGKFFIGNDKLDGAYALMAYVSGSALSGQRLYMNSNKSSQKVVENPKASGEEFAQKIRKEISDKAAADQKAAAEKKAAEQKKAADEKAAAEAKKYGLPQIKVSVNDMASSDGPQCKHRVYLDYVICDQKTGVVKDVKRNSVLLSGDNDTKSVTLTAPEGCVIRDGIHAEISSRSSGSATYVSKITGVFKYGSANTLNINLYGTTESLSLRSSGSSPFTKDSLSAEEFKNANLPK